jgi:tetratricopeptide (TPR) repeat protein
MTADALARTLFDACDRERLHDVDALFDRGLLAQRDGRTADALVAFDAAIAQQPDHPRSAEAAPAYAAYAGSIDRTDPERATAYLRKALRVAPDGPAAPFARSELALIEGRALRQAGIVDATPFLRALALDSTNESARAELERLRSDAATSRAQVHLVGRVSIALGLILAALAASVLYRTVPRSRRQAR